MNKLLSAAALCLLSTTALAQNSTATGVGVGQSESNSAAGAVAVNRGNGNSSSSLTVNNPANTTSTVNSNVSGTTTSNVNSTLSGTTTSNVNQRLSGSTRTEVSGTQTLKNVPTAFAPSLAAAGIETCLGSVSGGGSIVGFGGSFGTTVPDPGCQARLDARTLWSMGLKGAAVARLCIREDIYRSMPDVCERYRPPGAAYPVAVAPIVLSANSGPIEVVNGKTGRIGLCNRYDAAGQKCRQWAGSAQHPMPRRKQSALDAIQAAAPLPAPKPAEPPAVPY
jgi:hypothetical protein